MPKPCARTIGVAVIALVAGRLDRAVGGRVDRRALLGRDVEARDGSPVAPVNGSLRLPNTDVSHPPATGQMRRRRARQRLLVLDLGLDAGESDLERAQQAPQNAERALRRPVAERRHGGIVDPPPMARDRMTAGRPAIAARVAGVELRLFGQAVSAPSAETRSGPSVRRWLRDSSRSRAAGTRWPSGGLRALPGSRRETPATTSSGRTRTGPSTKSHDAAGKRQPTDGSRFSVRDENCVTG